MKNKNRFLLLLLFLILVLPTFSKEIAGLGVIYTERLEPLNKDLKEKLELELKKNFEGSNFDPKIVVEEHTKMEGIYSKIKDLENNKDVDAIMVLSIGDHREVLKEKAYDKLVIMPFEILPVEAKVKNLNRIYSTFNISEDIEDMKLVKDFKKLGVVVVHDLNATKQPEILARIEKTIKAEGVEPVFINIAESREDISRKLDEVEAVYIISASSENEEINKMIRERKLISFSLAFNFEKNYRSLMGYDSSLEINRRIRAASVNFVNYMKGENNLASDLGMSDRRIVFDMGLARELKIYPKILLTQKVDIINAEEPPKKSLNFLQAINLAFSENPDMKRRRSDIDVGKYSLSSAKSKRLPNVYLAADYARIDEDRAESPLTPAENTLYGGVELSQILFDENVNANIEINKKYLDAVNARYIQEELDTVLRVAEPYLNILELSSKLEIERYNYELLREFLKIAKTKYEVGTAGPEDIYRFESEIAVTLSDISETKGKISFQEAELNRMLNLPMSTRYSLEDLENDPKIMLISREVFEKTGYNESRLDRFLSYLMERGKKNSPELTQIEANIMAKKREYLAAKRERYIPKVLASAEYKDSLKDSWGTGSENVSDEPYWSVGVGFRLPIIKGGDIEYTKSRIEKEIQSLEYQKKSIENEIDKNISGQLALTLKDFFKTYTTKESAEAARKNLELVSEFYAKGTISISDLLDARTNSISADLVEVASKYSLLRSLIRLERNIGYYFTLKDEKERQKKLDEMRSIINE